MGFYLVELTGFIEETGQDPGVMTQERIMQDNRNPVVIAANDHGPVCHLKFCRCERYITLYLVANILTGVFVQRIEDLVVLAVVLVLQEQEQFFVVGLRSHDEIIFLYRDKASPEFLEVAIEFDKV